jgi:hypothetical protein
MRRLPAVELPYSALSPREAALRTASRRSRPKHDLRLDGRSKASSRRSIPLAALVLSDCLGGRRLKANDLSPPSSAAAHNVCENLATDGPLRSGAPVAATTLNERPLFESASSSVYGGDGRKADVTSSGRKRTGGFWLPARESGRRVEQQMLCHLHNGGCGAVRNARLSCVAPPLSAATSAWAWRSATGRKTRRASAEPAVRMTAREANG